MQKSQKGPAKASSVSQENLQQLIQSQMIQQQMQHQNHQLHLDTLKTLTELFTATKPASSTEAISPLNEKVATALDHLLKPFLPQENEITDDTI